MEKFISEAKRIVIGDPLDKATDMGPMVSEEHRESVVMLPWGLLRKQREHPTRGKMPVFKRKRYSIRRSGTIIFRFLGNTLALTRD